MKDNIISIILKILAVVIIILAIIVYFSERLYNPYPKTEYQMILKCLLPITTIGFSGCLYGIAKLLDRSKGE